MLGRSKFALRRRPKGRLCAFSDRLLSELSPHFYPHFLKRATHFSVCRSFGSWYAAPERTSLCSGAFVPTHRKASSIRLPPGPLHGCLDRPGGCGTVLPGQQSGDLSGRLLHLRVEGGGGNTQSSVTQNDHLLGVVRGSHPHPVLLPAEGIGGLLNIGVEPERLSDYLRNLN